MTNLNWLQPKDRKPSIVIKALACAMPSVGMALMLGPVVTEFGCHVILVTRRERNREQIEEKLARND